MKYKKQGDLLQLGTNTKLSKSLDNWDEYLIAGLSLAPSDLSGYRVCTHENVAACKPTCLFFAGRGAMASVQDSRIRKTKLFFEDRVHFLNLLKSDMVKMIRYCDKHQRKLAVRLNVLSDLLWETYLDMDSYSKYDVQFYDYTKRFSRLGKMPSNYDLTLSVYPHPTLFDKSMTIAKQTKTNIAVVFQDKIPRRFHGLPTFIGDDSDLRFLDPKPCCVALKAKGKLRNPDIINQMKRKLSFGLPLSRTIKEIYHA